MKPNAFCGGDWGSLLAAERKRAQLAHAAANLAAREAGTYWRERDAHRTATRPAHVLVDREAWKRARVDAISKWSSIGVVVGQLIAAEVRRPVKRDWQRDADRDRGHEIRLFVRLAVARETYGKARLMASDAGVTIERRLGVLVEDAYPSKDSR